MAPTASYDDISPKPTAATEPETNGKLLAEVEELRRTVAALRLSEARFSRAFHSNADALVISRLSDGAIIEVNPPYLQIVGYEAAEIVGKDRHTLKLAANTVARDKLVQRL